MQLQPAITAGACLLPQNFEAANLKTLEMVPKRMNCTEVTVKPRQNHNKTAFAFAVNRPGADEEFPAQHSCRQIHLSDVRGMSGGP